MPRVPAQRGIEVAASNSDSGRGPGHYLNFQIDSHQASSTSLVRSVTFLIRNSRLSVGLDDTVARDQMKNVPVLGRTVRGMSIFFDLSQLD